MRNTLILAAAALSLTACAGPAVSALETPPHWPR